MKRLILVRHAKSDWGFNVADFDRPLNERGHKNAPEMARRLSSRDIFPDLVVTSPAKRAQTTADYFVSEWNLSLNKLIRIDAIYEASIPTLLSVINGFDNQYQSVALFGHNPGMTEIANYLTGAGIINLVTCSVVVIDFDVEDWAHISAETGNIFLLDFPKNGLD
jgi:phosphohistidine phosphatase